MKMNTRWGDIVEARRVVYSKMDDLFSGAIEVQYSE